MKKINIYLEENVACWINYYKYFLKKNQPKFMIFIKPTIINIKYCSYTITYIFRKIKESKFVL
jgi:hypothetical protein